jgi:Rieske Fe-S protein
MRCDDCINRRQFLSAAAGAAGFVAIGCGDGVVTGPFTELPSGPITIIVASLPGLETVGRLVNHPSQAIALVRTGPSSFDALSMICTHQGCTTSITTNASRLDCPCHGSRFDNTGAVINGPNTGEGITPLPKFVTSYDPATDTLTIS